MPKELSPGKPNTRRYTPEEKTQAVRLVRQLRKEIGVDHKTVQRVAQQLGYGTESVRSWVKQADIDDGVEPGVTTEEAARVKALEQENRELRRTNEILKKAAAYSPRLSSTAHPGSRRLRRRPSSGVRGRAHLPCAGDGPEAAATGSRPA
jgi:transposase